MIANGTVIADAPGLGRCLMLRYGNDIQSARHNQIIELGGQARLVEIFCNFLDGQLSVGLITLDDKDISDEETLICSKKLLTTFTNLLQERFQEYPTIHA